MDGDLSILISLFLNQESILCVRREFFFIYLNIIGSKPGMDQYRGQLSPGQQDEHGAPGIKDIIFDMLTTAILFLKIR